MHGRAALGDGAIAAVERRFEERHRLGSAIGQQRAHCLHAEHQSLETLEQRVVQLARDAGSFVHSLIESKAELMCDLPNAQHVRHGDHGQHE